MSVLEVSQNGAFVFIGLEDDATGFQLVFKVTRPTSTTPTTVTAYEPGAGNTSNVAPTGDPDRMIFHGMFGTDVSVVDHAITAGTNTDISPPSTGSNWLQSLRVDPSDVSHIVVQNTDTEDALETEDGGSNWTTLNATIGLTANIFDAVFFGQYFPFAAFVGGPDATDENLTYTPNEFASLREDTSAALKAVSAIASIDIALDT